ncbi:hypothetical protein [Sphingomonas sp. RS2018]
MAKTLGQLSITQEADGYILHIEDEDGETVEYSATVDQIDDIAEAIEDILEMEDEDPLAAVDDEDERAAPDEE